MSLLVRNGTMVTHRARWTGDLRCRDGRIVELGSGLERAPGEELLDATGLLVFPGGVDPHVHLALRVAGTVSADDFESGTAAALAGGTTTVIDFVHPERGQSYLEALTDRLREASGAVADYALHMAVTWWGERSPVWMERLVREEGIPSFKAYMAYLDTVGIDDDDLLRVMGTVGELGGLLLVHAEIGQQVEELRNRLAGEGKREPKYHALSRPPALEGDATARASGMAAATGAALYVVHVTCRESVEAIAAGRRRHRGLHGETCPQYLLLDESAYERPDFEGAAYVMSPPLRPREHQEVLWQALGEDVLEVLATDHCPFTMQQKRSGLDDFRRIPGGAAGIEHRLALLWTHGVGAGRLDPHRFVELVSTRPAKLFGLYPRKGALQAGADADLVLWDPGAEGVISARTHHHRCDRSIYEGFRVRGLPAAVVAAGRVRYRDGRLDVEPGAGRFLRRRPTVS